jgi:putative peptidoglycan lipid II flippase
MAAGLVATGVSGALLTPLWGAQGIALANATGISLTAVLLLLPTRGRTPAARGLMLIRRTRWIVLPTVIAVVAGRWIEQALQGSPDLITATIGLVVVLGVYSAFFVATKARRG